MPPKIKIKNLYKQSILPYLLIELIIIKKSSTTIVLQ